MPLPVCVRTCAFGLHLYRQTTEAHAHAGSLDIWNNATVCVPARRYAAALPIQADNLSACSKWHPLHTWTTSRILLRNAWLTFYFCFSKLFIQYIKIIPFFYVVCNKSLACQWAQNSCCFLLIWCHPLLPSLICIGTICSNFSSNFRIVLTLDAAPSYSCCWWGIIIYFLCLNNCDVNRLDGPILLWSHKSRHRLWFLVNNGHGKVKVWSKIVVAEIKGVDSLLCDNLYEWLIFPIIILFPVVPTGGFQSELSSRIMSEMYAKRIKIVPS